MNPTTESRILGGLRIKPNNMTLSQELTLGHLPVVYAEAGKLAAGRQEVYRELVGVGRGELCQQVERCRTDPPRYRFLTRALPRIKGAMVDYLAQDGPVPLTSHGAKLERQARREGHGPQGPRYVTLEVVAHLSFSPNPDEDLHRQEYSPLLLKALGEWEQTGNVSLSALGHAHNLSRQEAKGQLRELLAVEADLPKRKPRTRKK